MWIQYTIIALIFVVAVYYIIRRFLPNKKNEGGCGKGCGCSAMTTDVKKKERALH